MATGGATGLLNRKEKAREIQKPSGTWEGRTVAAEQMATMVNMGLHVFNPEWQITSDQVPRGKMYSGSFRDVTLSLYKTGETLSFPVQTCTTVQDVKEAIATKLLLEPEGIDFLTKQGCTTRRVCCSEEMPRKVTVKGIDSFKLLPQKWPHPIAIIGAGFRGLKTSLLYLRTGNTNFIGFDRNSIFGGYCWITAANKTSRLQTELASFHVWSGHELLNERVSYPEGWGIWPFKTKVLEHFNWAAEQYGVQPYYRFRSNVTKMDIVGDKQAHDRYYNLSVMPEGSSDSSKVEEIKCSVIYHFGGSMTRNRIIEYPGEDSFEGRVGYGMNDDTPYDHLQDCRAAILGNGAFAVENARTCIEYGGKKVYLVTRRKNLASPRVPCWFVHQGKVPVPGAMVLNMFAPMYKLCGFGDPWDYFGVHGSKEKDKATIIQGSRFGIGDVTFLAVAYGRLEYVKDTLKRINKNKLILTSGVELTDINILLKALGLLGDFTVDRFHKMKQVVGQFCDGDWRRVYEIDATGMNAANFATFSQLGGIGSIRTFKFLHDYPKEFYRVQEPLLGQLPANKANEKEEKPCHVTDVKFAMSSALILETMVPNLSRLSTHDGEYKYRLYHKSHPLDKFLETAEASWNDYQTKWRSEGFDHEFMPYPYTKEMVHGFFEDFSKVIGEPVSPDGPASVSYPEKGEKIEAEALVGQPPPWAKDTGALDLAMSAVDSAEGHHGWWHAHGSGNAAFQRIAYEEARKNAPPYQPPEGTGPTCTAK